MPRSRRDTLRSVLLVAAVLAGLVAVRWAVTGGPNRPLAPPAPTTAPSRPDRGPARTVLAPPGARLSLGGRQPIVVDPTNGAITRIPSNPAGRTALFRQGAHTVLLANERAWAVPAGRATPRRPLGRALSALPALADDRVWLVDAHYGAPQEQLYELVEVGLADGRAHTRWTLPYQAAPVAVVSSGVLARDPGDTLELVEPGSGRVRAVLARAATFVDARGDRVAWLADRDLHIRDLATGAERSCHHPRAAPTGMPLAGPSRGQAAATGWARSRPTAAPWPSTPALPVRTPPGSPSSTWPGAAPNCCPDPKAPRRPAACPASAGPRTAGSTSSRPALRSRRSARGMQARDPPACSG
jgi:hypothetical protein